MVARATRQSRFNRRTKANAKVYIAACSATTKIELLIVAAIGGRGRRLHKCKKAEPNIFKSSKNRILFEKNFFLLVSVCVCALGRLLLVLSGCLFLYHRWQWQVNKLQIVKVIFHCSLFSGLWPSLHSFRHSCVLCRSISSLHTIYSFVSAILCAITAL